MINKYENLMREDLKYLQKSIEEKTNALQQLPSGTLSCYKDGDRYKWVQIDHYISDDNKRSRKKTIIKRNNENLAFQLAYKTYLEKQISDEERELRALNAYLKKTPPKDAASEYMKRNPELNRLLKPYTCKWDVNAEIWRNTPSEARNPISIKNPIITKAGDIVRSKGEMIICDRLFDLGVPYKVEKAVNVSQAFHTIDEMKLPYSGPRYNYLFPDITILDKNRGEIIWEHMGLCDDPKYMKHNGDKMLLYSLVGYKLFNNFIISCEDSEHYIDTVWIDKMIDYYLLH